MNYRTELDFVMENMRAAYDDACDVKLNVTQKSAFDLVTDMDKKIEKALSTAIRSRFPNDRILGEEFSSDQALCGRTWTIDPIDGTCNMANGSKMFGMQCSLICDGAIVLGAVYLPHFGEWIYAVKGGGCFCNGKRIRVADGISVNNAIVSFGDYPHANPVTAKAEHAAIGALYSQIAKIRMFGAACMDFSFVAQGRTHGSVVITTNLWDIAPGILLCEESGAVVTDLIGSPYRLGAEGVVVAANAELSKLIIRSLDQR